jgi:hypothetical protein
MAGKIIADTIETGAGADIPTSYVVNGSAKAWNVHTQAGTYVLHDSLNMSSLGDVGNGRSQFNWTSSFDSVYYSATVGVGEYNIRYLNVPAFGVSTNGNKTTAVLLFHSQKTNNADDDTLENSVTIHGDLA